jgi:hypothetical protein
MRRFLAILFLLLAAGPLAQAAHVYFNLHDFTQVSTNLASRSVFITPLSTPRIDGERIVSSDRLTFTTDTNASFTVSNMVHGNYSVDIPGPFKVTNFRILVPDTNSFLNATGLLTAAITVPAATAGYTQPQADALLTNAVRVAAGTNVTVQTNVVGRAVVFTVNATASGGGGGGGGSTAGVILRSGTPEEAERADPGRLAYDVTAGAMFLKASGDDTDTGWIQLFKTGYDPYVGTLSYGGSGITFGTGSPETQVIGDPGAMYFDASGRRLYLKQSGEGLAIGWIQLLGLGDP